MAGEASTTGIATHKGQTSQAERSGRSVQILSTASGGSPPFLILPTETAMDDDSDDHSLNLTPTPSSTPTARRGMTKLRLGSGYQIF
ncbi:LOW QUALITY PROTEIN: hypothetical protein CsatA_025942 [Cannabis sativa]